MLPRPARSCRAVTAGNVGKPEQVAVLLQACQCGQHVATGSEGQQEPPRMRRHYAAGVAHRVLDRTAKGDDIQREAFMHVLCNGNTAHEIGRTTCNRVHCCKREISSHAVRNACSHCFAVLTTSISASNKLHSQRGAPGPPLVDLSSAHHGGMVRPPLSVLVQNPRTKETCRRREK